MSSRRFRGFFGSPGQGVLLVVLASSCSANEGAAPPGVEQQQACEATLRVVERSLLDPAAVQGVFGEAVPNERIRMLADRCGPSPRRDLATANLMAAAAMGDEALAYLQSRRFTDDKWERVRLLQLYQGHFAQRNRDAMLEVKSELLARHLDSPEQRLVAGLELCLTGFCHDAVPDLAFAAERSGNLLAVRYLMVAYFTSNRPADALALLDAGILENGVINEHMLFASVSVYLQAGRRADAERVLEHYRSTHGDRVHDPNDPNDLVAKTQGLLSLDD